MVRKAAMEDLFLPEQDKPDINAIGIIASLEDAVLPSCKQPRIGRMNLKCVPISLTALYFNINKQHKNNVNTIQLNTLLLAEPLINSFLRLANRLLLPIPSSAQHLQFPPEQTQRGTTWLRSLGQYTAPGIPASAAATTASQRPSASWRNAQRRSIRSGRRSWR